MNLEICKACQHCKQFPATDAELNEHKHRVFHCNLAQPEKTPHGWVFTADNPTNIIGEEVLRPHIDKSTRLREFKMSTELKKLFKIPAACPFKDKQ